MGGTANLAVLGGNMPPSLRSEAGVTNGPMAESIGLRVVGLGARQNGQVARSTNL